MNQSKKGLSAKTLINAAYEIFKNSKIPQLKGNRKEPITITDCLMSGLAIFGLKYPSLLEFNEDCNQKKAVKHNLRTLYNVNNFPCDTYVRERLDEVDPIELREPFKNYFSKLQRAGILKSFQYIDDHYVLSIDGTGIFSSPNVHCNNCCVKEHKDGSTTYYHQMLAGVLVHPSIKQVIPFVPEPIMKNDGDTKNDCEFNAFKRFIKDLRREHPHLKIIIVADGLFSKGPILKLLKENNLRYIIGAKQGDHKSLYDFVKGMCLTHTSNTLDGSSHQFSYMNQVPLNDANPDLLVNFLDYREIKKKGEKTRFTWITDLKIGKNNVYKIMRGGRARWCIENETFNTLKTQGYNFEHNFGHGKLNLNTVFATLMMLAFFIDQIQALCDPPFQNALTKELKKPKRLWRTIRELFFCFRISSWEDLWNTITYGLQDIDLKQHSLSSDSS